MSRPRKSAPLPAPFDRALFRHQLCAQAHVSEGTVVAWAGGKQTVGEHYCRALMLGCQALGIVPPEGAKLPPPFGTEPDSKKPLRVLA